MHAREAARHAARRHKRRSTVRQVWGSSQRHVGRAHARSTAAASSAPHRPRRRAPLRLLLPARGSLHLRQRTNPRRPVPLDDSSVRFGRRWMRPARWPGSATACLQRAPHDRRDDGGEGSRLASRQRLQWERKRLQRDRLVCPPGAGRAFVGRCLLECLPTACRCCCVG